jgi:diguanylate cyclase (GGDEF)-like protein
VYIERSSADYISQELAADLYKSTRAALTVSIAAVIASMFSGIYIDSTQSKVASIVVCFTVSMRIGLFAAYPHKLSRSFTADQTKKWTILYGVASMSLNIGMAIVCIISFNFGPTVALVPFSWAMATAAGSALRTSLVPWLAIATASVLLIPVALATMTNDNIAVKICSLFAIMNLYGTVQSIKYIHANFRDRLRSQYDITYQASHDSLTDLLNKRAFEECMNELYSSGVRGALLALDLDGFKPINDSYGHAAGDQILSCVGKRLRRVTSQNELIARVGGDEFLILTLDRNEAGKIASLVLDSLSEPFALKVGEARIGVSIGAAIWVQQSPDQLASEADAALYEAKRSGRGRYVLSEERRILPAAA